MTRPPPPVASTTYRPSHPVDLGFVLMGAKTVHHRSGVRWWLTTSPHGPAAMAFRSGRDGVRADGWGPGADWTLDQLPALLGAHDDPSTFRPHHRVLSALLERFDNPVIGATNRWFEALATTVVGQRVVKVDAATSRRRLSDRFGEGVPGPAPVPAFPTPERLLELADHHFHRAGVERSRARALRTAARHADRIEELGSLDGTEAIAWLRRLPGIGPWTAAITSAVAGGDPDAVPVGDLHMPRIVSYALTGEAGGDDDRMLELLEPYTGNRQRVIRLVKLGGLGPPRHRPAPTRHDIGHL